MKIWEEKILEYSLFQFLYFLLKFSFNLYFGIKLKLNNNSQHSSHGSLHFNRQKVHGVISSFFQKKLKCLSLCAQCKKFTALFHHFSRRNWSACHCVPSEKKFTALFHHFSRRNWSACQCDQCKSSLKSHLWLIIFLKFNQSHSYCNTHMLSQYHFYQY